MIPFVFAYRPLKSGTSLMQILPNLYVIITLGLTLEVLPQDLAIYTVFLLSEG